MPLPHNRVLFISYSHAWDEWSLQLTRAIFDTKLYFPFRDDRIPKTADWWQSLCQNIETSVAVVALLTPEYLRSVFCMGELDYALALKKPVVPVMLNLPSAQYPPQLAGRNLQFISADTAWSEQAMRESILSAMNQVMIDYAGGRYPSEDAAFQPRPDTLRPPVPASGNAASQGDRQIQQQMQAPAVHVAKTERDVTALVKSYYETKASDPFAAGNILTQISQRDDLPFYFDVAGEREDLQIELDRVKLRRKQQSEQARLDKEYDELEIVVTHQKPEKARKIVRDWLAQTGYPDKKDYLKQLVIPAGKILPAPFAWIDIPGTLGKNWQGAPYRIAKYPVTNAQFARFVEGGGYTEKRWWAEAGWELRESKSWTEPRYWQDSQWNGAEYPVVGVSWYEAVAFCLWLSDATGEEITLPAEDQWQYAARGDDGRTYPWGNEWDAGRCNTKEAGIGKTTPVRQYEGKGESPFGVVDMVGNVWEWCVTDYTTGNNAINSSANIRVVRGGSWRYVDYGARAAARYWGFPDLGSNNRGFRVVCAAPI